MAGTIRKRTWATRKGESKTAWVADYFDQHRRRHKKQFATRRAADAWLLQARGEVRDGVHTPDSASLTVGEAAERWLKRAATNGLERGSQRAYEQLVRLAITPHLGQTRLARLTRPQVETFRDGLLAEFAYARARRTLGMLKAIIEHAHSQGLVAQNAARGVRIAERTRLQERLIIGRTIPTPAEVRTLIDASRGWLRVLLTLAAFTGMRQGELRGLLWEDVDLAGGVVRVRQRADQWGAFGPPKSKAGQRRVRLAPAAAAELRRWRLACGHPHFVFPARAPDAVIGQSSITLAFARLQVGAGIASPDPHAKDANGCPVMRARYVFHALRHFFASVMIGLGYTSKWLQVTMGHENIVLTLGIYGHLFPDDADAAARMTAFEAAVLGKPG
jgi:integrase